MQSKIKLLKGERLDDLLIDGRKIIQNKNLYTFTSDSVLLSKFVKVKKRDAVCELCSGSGIIGILIELEQSPKQIVMVEIQKSLAQMCRRSIALNGLDEKISVVNRPLQKISKEIGVESFDAVVCNPPYFKTSSSAHCQNESVQIAREEKLVNLKEICFEASKLVRFGGSFYCLYPADRIFELDENLKQNGFQIKEVLFVCDRQNQATLALVKSVKGGKSGVKIKTLCKEGKQ